MSLTSRTALPAAGGGIFLLPLFVFGALWFVLVDQVRVDWTINPQYAYGWAVPFLCLYLIWERIRKLEFRSELPEIGIQPASSGFARSSAVAHRPSSVVCFLFLLLALTYAPTRLVQEANPYWRLPLWLLALEVVGLTLLSVRFALGARRLAQLAFPICFFLVSIPWPSLLANLLVRGLTGLNVFLTTEMLGWFGVMAVPHGNVIEVSTGMVGVDEACSGIRSLQATLMISLFLGEIYALNVSRRVLCVFAGFGLSFLFNVCRTSVLVCIAAHKGVPAIAQWHDPAGISILVACFLVLWGIGVLLKGKSGGHADCSDGRLHSASATDAQSEVEPLHRLRHLKIATQVSFGLAGWVLVVELGTGLWYRHLESNLPRGPVWSVAWPEDNAAFKELPISAHVRKDLKYNEGRQAEWQEPAGVNWQGFYFHWLPGRAAGYLARQHMPEICLPGVGLRLQSASGLAFWNVRGLRLPFRKFVFTEGQRPLHVFYCRWEEGINEETYVTEKFSRYYFIRSVWAGRGNLNQKVLELAVWGIEDDQEAEAAARRQLEKLVRVGS